MLSVMLVVFSLLFAIRMHSYLFLIEGMRQQIEAKIQSPQQQANGVKKEHSAYKRIINCEAELQKHVKWMKNGYKVYQCITKTSTTIIVTSVAAVVYT